MSGSRARPGLRDWWLRAPPLASILSGAVNSGHPPVAVPLSSRAGGVWEGLRGAPAAQPGWSGWQRSRGLRASGGRVGVGIRRKGSARRKGWTQEAAERQKRLQGTRGQGRGGGDVE